MECHVWQPLECTLQTSYYNEHEGSELAPEMHQFIFVKAILAMVSSQPMIELDRDIEERHSWDSGPL